jgi:hypothetical protein
VQGMERVEERQRQGAPPRRALTFHPTTQEVGISRPTGSLAPEFSRSRGFCRVLVFSQPLAGKIGPPSRCARIIDTSSRCWP